MALPVVLRGKDGTGGVVAEVTSRGQLITAPIDYSKPYVASVTVANTAYNLIVPKTNTQFVITDIVITGTKSIDPNTDAEVIIYEAGTETSLTVNNTLIELSVPRSAIIPLTGLNVITENVSTYINIKSSDVTIKCTLMGYHIGHHHTI